MEGLAGLVRGSVYGADFPGLRSKWEVRRDGGDCSQDFFFL